MSEKKRKDPASEDDDDEEVPERARLAGFQLIEGVKLLIARSNAGLPVKVEEKTEGTVADTTEIHCVPVLVQPRELNLGTIMLVKNAVWCVVPPRFPASGIYCFPSGNFIPESDLGWKMEVIRKQPRRCENGQTVRDSLLRCKDCGAQIRAKIGPFITTLLVPVDGIPHKPH